MKKITDILVIIFIFFGIYFLQSNFFTWFNIAGVMPNLFVIFIMLISLYMKKEFAFSFAIFFGILLDIFIGVRIGINTISLLITAIIGKILDRNFSKDNRMTLMIITMFLTFIYECVTYLLIMIIARQAIYVQGFIKIELLEILYNAILIIIIYPLFCKLGDKLERDFIAEKGFLKNL